MSIERFSGGVNFQTDLSVHSVTGLLHSLQQPGAGKEVHINSTGGTFDYFDVLGPAIERQGITTVAGNVGSAANVLYLLGHERLARPDATFFFHEVQAVVGSNQISLTTAEEFRDHSVLVMKKDPDGFDSWIDEMRAAQNWFLEFMNAKTGVAKGTFLNLMREEATLSAHDAREYGIVHDIVSSGRYY